MDKPLIHMEKIYNCIIDNIVFMKLAISLVPVFPNQKTQQNKNFKQSKKNALRTWNLGLLIDTLVSYKIFCSDLDVKSTKVTSRNDQ